jgi:hypothetical protein
VTLWHTRQPPPEARGATHALVIGVSEYRHLAGGPEPRGHEDFGLRQVTTPAAGAMAFARWLRDAHHDPDAPLASIRLLLAPSPAERREDAELDAAASASAAPTRAAVEEALFAWRAACEGDRDGAAVLYVSGHGLQVTREDAVVLLTDFAATPNVMSNALEVGTVRKGMAGARMPQRQWYFVDACRIAPAALRRWERLGTPLGLPVEARGADRRASPVFFSASPDTAALGQRGRGTLFSQALLTCLAGDAAESREGHLEDWYVSGYSLQTRLSEEVARLAGALGYEQDTVLGGQLRPAIFHHYRERPVFPVIIEVIPEDAEVTATADLWAADGRTAVFRAQPFEHRRLERTIPVGHYRLDVRIRPPAPPLEDRSLPCLVMPRLRRHTVNLA